MLYYAYYNYYSVYDYWIVIIIHMKYYATGNTNIAAAGINICVLQKYIIIL